MDLVILTIEINRSSTFIDGPCNTDNRNIIGVLHSLMDLVILTIEI